MLKLKFCVKTWMGSILLSGLRDQNLGENGAQGSMGPEYTMLRLCFRSVYSPALMHVYNPFFWHGVSLPRTHKILKGSATAGFDPLYCSFGKLCLCWLRYEKETRYSPSPWYRRQGYHALVSPFRQRRRVSKISLVSFISHLFTTLSRY